MAAPADDSCPSPGRRSLRIDGHEIMSGVGDGVGGGGVGGSGHGSGGGSSRTEGAVPAQPPSGRCWSPPCQLSPCVRRDEHAAGREPAAGGGGGRGWGRWGTGTADSMAVSYVAVPRLPGPLRGTMGPVCLCRGGGFNIQRRVARVYRRGSKHHSMEDQEPGRRAPPRPATIVPVRRRVGRTAAKPTRRRGCQHDVTATPATSAAAASAVPSKPRGGPPAGAASTPPHHRHDLPQTTDEGGHRASSGPPPPPHGLRQGRQPPPPTPRRPPTPVG